MATRNQTSQGYRGLTEREACEILRNDRHRAITEQLRQTLTEAPLRMLAEDIAQHETSKSPSHRNIHESVNNALYQIYLPKLDQRRIVEYDEDRKLVSLQRDTCVVNPYRNADQSEEYDVTWTKYDQSLAVVGLLIVILADLRFPVVGAVDVVLWSSFFLFVVAVSMAYRLWDPRWVLFERFVTW